jgi:hypothetical protein
MNSHLPAVARIFMNSSQKQKLIREIIFLNHLIIKFLDHEKDICFSPDYRFIYRL